MAYEAMNNAGASRANMIVVLNDNDMSIAPPVGAMSAYLSRLISSRPFLSLRDLMTKMARRFPRPLEQAARRADEFTRGLLTGGTLFEELGFYYVGPIDGHDLDHLMRCCATAGHGPRGRSAAYRDPQEGATPCRTSADSTTASKFNVVTGEQSRRRPVAVYTRSSPRRWRGRRQRIVAVTAAMPWDRLDLLPSAEPHVRRQHRRAARVTFAAGMATEGMKPFCAICSTFLQRAYDQVVHDVALQSLPVRFAPDRAGLVGADGATHAGAFDIVYLGCLPNMVLMAAADELELMHGATAAAIDDRPSAFRYPRARAGLVLPERARRWSGAGGSCAGWVLPSCPTARAWVPCRGRGAARRPVHRGGRALRGRSRGAGRAPRARARARHGRGGAAGGFGSLVMQHLAWRGLLDGRLKVRPMTLPDRLIDHDSQPRQYEEAGLNASRIMGTVLGAVDRPNMLRTPTLARTS